MCLVPDHEIEARLRDGSLVITDFMLECLTPNGYDLRVAEARLEGEESVTLGTSSPPWRGWSSPQTWRRSYGPGHHG